MLRMNKKISGSNSLNFVSVSNFTAHAPHRDFFRISHKSSSNLKFIWSKSDRWLLSYEHISPGASFLGHPVLAPAAASALRSNWAHRQSRGNYRNLNQAFGTIQHRTRDDPIQTRRRITDYTGQDQALDSRGRDPDWPMSGFGCSLISLRHRIMSHATNLEDINLYQTSPDI